jgi:hypothetical protein
MSRHLFSAGYVAHRLQSDVYHIRLAAKELEIEPAQWVDDIDYYDGEDVIKLREYLDRDNKKVTR